MPDSLLSVNGSIIIYLCARTAGRLLRMSFFLPSVSHVIDKSTIIVFVSTVWFLADLLRRVKKALLAPKPQLHRKLPASATRMKVSCCGLYIRHRLVEEIYILLPASELVKASNVNYNLLAYADAS